MVKRDYARIGETVFEETLENGLRVFVFPKPEFGKYYAFFATRYGGMDTRFQKNGQWLDTPMGIAHYLEHKMFDTPDGGNALQTLSSTGASPNAFTSTAITGYHFECADQFWDNLRTLLEFVSVPYFTKESVDKEQGIIGQEIRMIEDQPGWQAYHLLLEALYQYHPVRNSVAGSVESIAEITAETLYQCHEAFYTPSNMVLCVAGNVEPQKVCDMAREILPSQAKPPIPRDCGEKEPVRTAGPWRCPLPCSRWESKGSPRKEVRPNSGSASWENWPVKHWREIPVPCTTDCMKKALSTAVFTWAIWTIQAVPFWWREVRPKTRKAYGMPSCRKESRSQRRGWKRPFSNG